MSNQPPRPYGSPELSPTPALSQWSEDRQWWYDWQEKRWRPAAEWQGAPPPPPSPRKRRRAWPWVVGGLAALVVLMGVCVAALASVGPTQTSTTRTATQATPAAQKATATPAPTRDGSCNPQPCANDNYGWIVVIGNLKYGVTSPNQFEHPESGNVYVTLDVTFTNKLAQEQHANPTEFVLLDGAGVKHTTTFATFCESWSPVNVTSGASYGPKCVVFEATANKPQGLVLVWTPHFAGGDYRIKLS